MNMNNYPLCLLGREIFPILGRDFAGKPMYFPIDDASDVLRAERSVSGQENFQTAIEGLMAENNATWAISGYLEKRTSLADYTDDVRTNRPYHVGVDVTAPVGTRVYAPLDAEVIEVGDDSYGGASGYKGGYGGFVVLKHNLDGFVFYTVWGHLNSATFPVVGTKLKAGDRIGEFGDMSQNGHWFYHVHLQVITQRGFDEGWVQRGLCGAGDVARMNELCPNPLFLIV